jgi:hypothetical protein
VHESADKASALGSWKIYSVLSSIVDSVFLQTSSHRQTTTQQSAIISTLTHTRYAKQHRHQSIPKHISDLNLPPQQHDTTNLTTMPSSDWEQHFLDKFIAGSSRPASPASSQPRTSSPARRNMTSAYTGHQQPHSTAIGRTSSPARMPTNITSAAR